MQAIHVPTAPRADLLDQFTELPTDELRGILVRRAAEVGSEFLPGRVAYMHGLPGPAKLANGHAATNGAAAPEPVKRAAKRVRRKPAKARVRTSPTALEVKIMSAIEKGARSRGQIRAVTRTSRSQAATALKQLRHRGEVHMAGDRRFARYAPTKAEAERASEQAAAAAKKGATRPGLARTKGKGPTLKKARGKPAGGRAKPRATTS